MHFSFKVNVNLFFFFPQLQVCIVIRVGCESTHSRTQCIAIEDVSGRCLMQEVSIRGN